MQGYSLCRCQIVCNDNLVIKTRVQLRGFGKHRPKQLDHHSIYDLMHVVFLASQVRIFDLVEERDQRVGVCF